jgi:signal transduction histidine kinase
VKYFLKPRSLKWRLVSRFSLALALIMVAFYVALIIFVVAEVSDVNPSDDMIKSDIASSIQSNGSTLQVVPNEALKTVIQEYPNFWLIARDKEGREAKIGNAPAELDAILSNFDRLNALDVRVSQDSPMTATLTFLDTDAGRLKAVYGGKSAPGTVVEYMVRVLRIIYLPTTLIPLLLAVVIIPLIVNSSLSGIKRITALADQIDVNKPGVRLPTENLVKEIAPLVTTINSALERVDSDVSARERFLADAAHELRTPIAILKTRIEGYNDSEQNRRLLADVSRIGAVAEQLLDIQRFAVVTVRTQTDLAELCRQVVGDLAPLAIEAGYDLSFEGGAQPVIVSCDRLSVERAVSNLIHNAIQHAGGSGQIRVKLLLDGSIEVSDEGAGILPEERERVFDPFYRSTPKSSGAGLGLSLVRQIALLHGGDAVALPADRGALFRLILGTPVNTG